MYRELALVYKAMHAVDEFTDKAISKAADAAVKKVVGESLGAIWKKAKDFVAERTEGFPGNHDLQKALRICMLTATDMVRKSMKENKEDEDFRSVLHDWIAEQGTSNELDKLHLWANEPNIAVAELDLLMTSNEAFTKKKESVSLIMTQQWNDYLVKALTQSWNEPLPTTFTNKLFGEFEYDGQKFKWHVAVYVLFAEMMRNGKTELGKRADKAFNHSFLADISQKIDELSEDITDIKVDIILIKDSLKNPPPLRLADIPGWEKLIEFKEELGFMTKAIADLSETILSQQRTLELQEQNIQSLLKIVGTQQIELAQLREELRLKGDDPALKQRIADLESADKIARDQLYDFYRSYPATYSKELAAIEEVKTKAEESKRREEARLKRQQLEEEENQKDAEFEYDFAIELEEQLRYSDALIHHRKALSLQPQNPLYLNNFGSFLLTMAFYDEAINVLNKALSIVKNQRDLEDKTGFILNILGLAWRNKGEYDKAISYYEKALAIQIKFFGEEHPSVAVQNINLGAAWHSKGEFEKAVSYYEIALTINIKLFGEEHTSVAAGYNNLGGVWNDKGEYDIAISYYEKALTINKTFFSEEHPNVAVDYNNIGTGWYDKGEYDKAMTYFEKALDIEANLFTEEHPNVARDYNNLGMAWLMKGKYDKAIDYFDKALVIDIKFFGQEHPNVAVRNNNLGLAWKNKGEHSKAIEYYENALKIDIKFFEEEHPNVARHYNNLGVAWHEKGQFDKAINYYQKSLTILKKFHPTGHPKIDMCENSLASAISERDQS